MDTRAEFELLLIGDEVDGDALSTIARSLREFGIEAEVAALDPSGADVSEVGTRSEMAKAIAIAFGSLGPSQVLRVAWSDVLADVDRPRFVILLPGAPDHVRGLELDESFQVHLRKGIDDRRQLKAFAAELERLRDMAPPEAAPTSEIPAQAPPPGTPPPTPPPTPNARRQPDDTLGWDQLDDDARAALAAADAVRAATSQPEVHMEHLLAGLYRQDPGPLRQATVAAGVSETAFRTILNDTAKASVPGDADLHIAPLDRQPRLSGHSRQALLAARGLAGRRGTARV